MSDTAQDVREGAQDGAFEALLEFIRDNRGFDFTGYKRPSLRRRIDKRVVTLGIDSYADYLAHLEANQDEFVDLFNTILINVTSFFRDPAAWEYLAAEIVPRILESRPAPEPIRVWSAGCASGEEAYTVAMLLAEALDELGLPLAREDLCHRRRRAGARAGAARGLRARRTSRPCRSRCRIATSSCRTAGTSSGPTSVEP